MPRNVLYTIPSLEIGGTEMQLALLVRRLLKTEYTPHVLCALEEGPLAEPIRKMGIAVDCLNAKKCISARVCSQVKIFCKEWKIDLLHTYLFGMDLGAVHGARSAGVKAVITSRRQIPDWKTWYHLKAQRMANKRTDRVVCNAAAVRDYICDQEGLPREKTKVIYNGFPEESIPERPLLTPEPPKREALRSLMIEPDEKVICCVANFSEVKNHRRLLDAFRKVLLQGVKVRLVLVGDGPLRKPMELYAEQNSLGRATVFLGHRLDRLKILGECHALILPSLNEGFPNAVLEAQALGIPVVASDRGGIPELIEHGETGWLFDPTDKKKIAGAIWTALHQEEDAIRVARNAQKQARERFTARNLVAEHVLLYDQLLK